jgi:hypothetical protein
MKLLSTFLLLIICLAASAQIPPTKKGKIEKTFSGEPLTFYPGTYIDSESRYTDFSGISVIIQNSLPKGGGYTDPSGQNFGYRIFWTRVINESDHPVELTISFPANLNSLVPSRYVKIFLPSDTMSLEKEALYAYGAAGLERFLDSGLHKPTSLRRTLKPREACMFYVGALFNKGEDRVRAGLVLKGDEFFYSIKGISPELDSVLIPCGQINLKK